jgi:hypothetical protein
MEKSSGEIHDRIYQELKINGFQGWGGSAFPRRIEGREKYFYV